MMKTLYLAITAIWLIPAGALFADDSNKANDPEFIRQAALRIDTHVAAWYRQQKLPVPEVTDDSTFLRRAFLVGIGRVPTTEEALFFLEIDEDSKRQQLIDYLLDSPGFSSHMSNWAFDLIRVVDGGRNVKPGTSPYREWVRHAIDTNMPWDRMTRALLASRGDGWDPDSAALGYYIRDKGMPLDNLANSMEIFLSTKMECAQCHDDPFGETERHDFFNLAAFVAGQNEAPQKRNLRALYDQSRDPEHRGKLESKIVEAMWFQVFEQSLYGGGNGRIKLPNDYQYRDGEPGELIGAKTPFGKSVRMSDRSNAGDGRKELAEWVTSKTGNQFPAAIANRMWKRVMGRGVYEPVNSYVPASDTNLPGLMEFLTDLMVELDYDLKAFQKVLLNTKTFQFVPNPDPPKVLTGDDFHGRQLTRLSAEQIWDSLITLANGNPDKRPRRKIDERLYIGNQPVLVGKKSMREFSREVLELKTEQDFINYRDKLLEEIRKEGKGGGGSAADMMMGEVVRYDSKAQIRASELPSPAPKNHLLFLFGQSEREVIEAGNSEPNVGQVLTLMNGFVQKQLVNNSKAHIYQSLKGASDPHEKVRRLYIGILNRPPTDEEMGWMMDEVKISGDSEEAYRNIVSALVMSSEFLFLQ